jgi:hypothetical protein
MSLSRTLRRRNGDFSPRTRKGKARFEDTEYRGATKALVDFIAAVVKGGFKHDLQKR